MPLCPLSSSLPAVEEMATMVSAAPVVLNPLPLPHPFHPQGSPADPTMAVVFAAPADRSSWGGSEGFSGGPLPPPPHPLHPSFSRGRGGGIVAPVGRSGRGGGAAFPACGSSGPLPPPTLPQASPMMDPTAAASPSDPVTSVALAGRSAGVCCLFCCVYVMMMLLLWLILD